MPVGTAGQNPQAIATPWDLPRPPTQQTANYSSLVFHFFASLALDAVFFAPKREVATLGASSSFISFSNSIGAATFLFVEARNLEPLLF